MGEWVEFKGSLPLPRLQLKCIAQEPKEDGCPSWRWDYTLQYQHLLDQEVGIEMGWTKCSGSLGGERANRPLRDGAHITHDSRHLGIPAFAVWEDGYMERYSENATP